MNWQYRDSLSSEPKALNNSVFLWPCTGNLLTTGAFSTLVSHKSMRATYHNPPELPTKSEQRDTNKAQQGRTTQQPYIQRREKTRIPKTIQIPDADEACFSNRSHCEHSMALVSPIRTGNNSYSLIKIHTGSASSVKYTCTPRCTANSSTARRTPTLAPSP